MMTSALCSCNIFALVEMLRSIFRRASLQRTGNRIGNLLESVKCALCANIGRSDPYDAFKFVGHDNGATRLQRIVRGSAHQARFADSGLSLHDYDLNSARNPSSIRVRTARRISEVALLREGPADARRFMGRAT